MKLLSLAFLEDQRCEGKEVADHEHDRRYLVAGEMSDASQLQDGEGTAYGGDDCGP